MPPLFFRAAAALASLAVLAGASAHAERPETLLAGRAALLAADGACDLLPGNVRTLLEASTLQARGALLRAGWSGAEADALRSRAEAGAHARCDDPAVRRAAADAGRAFDALTRLRVMRYPGDQRAWSARRYPDSDGFTLRQNGENGAVLGLSGDALALRTPSEKNRPAPSSARLAVRDVERARQSVAEWPGRAEGPLERRAAPAGYARLFLASARRVENAAVTFEFPDAARSAIAALDPREAIAITLTRRGQRETLYFEAGDFAAAEAFLRAK